MSIDLKDWVLFGAGGNGKTYRPADPADDKVLLKVNNGSGASYERVKLEYDSSCAVRSIGVETPEMYEIVQVGKNYGVLFQRIKGKKSLCRVCADNPERIEEMATLLSTKGRELHALECDNPFFSPVAEHIRKGLDVYRPFLKKSECAIVEQWIDELPDVKNCLHGDFNPGNLILAEDKTYWIDLGRFTYGDPMLDMSHLYLFCVAMSGKKIVQDLAHMTEEQLKAFWAAFLKAEGITGPEEIQRYENKLRKYMVLDMMARHGFQKSSILAFLTSKTLKKIIAEY